MTRQSGISLLQTNYQLRPSSGQGWRSPEKWAYGSCRDVPHRDRGERLPSRRRFGTSGCPPAQGGKRPWASTLGDKDRLGQRRRRGERRSRFISMEQQNVGNHFDPLSNVEFGVILFGATTHPALRASGADTAQHRRLRPRSQKEPGTGPFAERTAPLKMPILPQLQVHHLLVFGRLLLASRA